MPSPQVQPLAQGPPNLVKGSRAEGSADEVLAIALAAIAFNKRCGGEGERRHSLEGLLMSVESDCGLRRGRGVAHVGGNTPARAHARTHARTQRSCPAPRAIFYGAQ